MTASYIDQGKVCWDEFDLGLAVHCGKVRYIGDLAKSIQNAMKEEFETLQFPSCSALCGVESVVHVSKPLGNFDGASI
jgi:hypothetical protein